MNILSRSIVVMLTHTNVVRHLGDVYYDRDDNIVEIDDAIVQAYIDANNYKTQRNTMRVITCVCTSTSASTLIIRNILQTQTIIMSKRYM
jgi:hypothetical protein